MNMHKKHQREITHEVFKRGLSFLYATHRHDLFYITMKYRQNIPDGFHVIEPTQKCLWTDRRMDARLLLYPPNLSVGDKNGCALKENNWLLFSLKNNEKVFMNVVCCSPDWRLKG